MSELNMNKSLERNSDHEEFLTFLMDKEEYGVDILSVQEIRGWTAVRPIPNTPSFIKGVINLRGIIVPIIDMRERFGLSMGQYDQTTVVIVLNAKVTDGECLKLGIVVDAVSEVYDLKTDNIKPAPDFGTRIDTRYIRGMATVNEKMILLIDVKKLMAPNELYFMKEEVINNLSSTEA